MAGVTMVVGERMIIGERMVMDEPDVTTSNSWFNDVDDSSPASTNTITITGLQSGVGVTITLDNDNSSIIESIVIVSGAGSGSGTTAVTGVENGTVLRCDYFKIGGTQVGTSTVRNATDGNTIVNTHSVILT
jgi:hypothetical protein